MHVNDRLLSPGRAQNDPETKLAAIVDPELEMVEPVLDHLFEHGLRPRYIIDTHTHADHISGARELHEKAPASGYIWESLRSSSSTPRGTPRIW